MKRTRVLLTLALPVALGLILVLGGGDSDATTFGTGPSVATWSTTAPDTPRDNSLDGGTPAPDDLSGTSLFFSALEETDADPGEIPLGAVMGEVAFASTLSLLNGPCNSLIPNEFTFLNASVDISDTIDRLAPGAPNPYTPLTDDADGNGLADHIDKYPSFLNSIYDPDGSGPLPPLEPELRLAGNAVVAGANTVITLVSFPAGDLTTFEAPQSQLGTFFGEVSEFILNDIGDPEGVNNPASPVSGLCSPLTNLSTVFGVSQDNPDTLADEGGFVSLRTPPAGAGIAGTQTHLVPAFSIGSRDADDDGKENANDKCPLVADSTDFRTADTTNDTDADGIPNVCDPTPDENTGLGDHDGDGFANRLDNCPTVSNPIQEESEPGSAPDGNEGQDSIGDACDDNPTTPDGHYHATFTFDAFCVSGTDSDGDGFCDATETLLGSNTGAAGSTPEHIALHFPLPLNDANAEPIPPATSGVAQPCTDGIDNDGDGQVDEADSDCAGTSDIDGDGFDENSELFSGTDPRYDCPVFSGHDAWAPDVNNDGRVTIADVLLLKTPFGSQSGQPNYTARADFSADGRVTIADVLLMKDPFGTQC